MDPDEKLLRGYEITRRSIDALDNSVSESRKGFLTIIGIIGTIAAALIGLIENKEVQVTMPQTEVIITAIGSFVAVFIFIFWGLDVYYTSKIRVASRTAIRYEEKLGFSTNNLESDARLGVTNELENYSKKREYLPKFYHLIYAVPGMALIMVMSYLNKDGLAKASLGGLAIVSIYIAFCIFLFWFWMFTDWTVEDFIEDRKKEVTKWQKIQFISRTILLVFLFILALEMFPDIAMTTVNGKLIEMLNIFALFSVAMVSLAFIGAFGGICLSWLKKRRPIVWAIRLIKK